MLYGATEGTLREIKSILSGGDPNSLPAQLGGCLNGATEQTLREIVEILKRGGIQLPEGGSVEIDDTLTQQGKAADAKAAGDRFAAVEDELNLFRESIWDTWESWPGSVTKQPFGEKRGTVLIPYRDMKNETIMVRGTIDTEKEFFMPVLYKNIMLIILNEYAEIDADGYLSLFRDKYFKIFILDAQGNRLTSKPATIKNGGFELEFLQTLQENVTKYSLQSGAELKQLDSAFMPIAEETKTGGVKPVTKTEAMTRPVGVDANGQLWTESLPVPTNIGDCKVLVGSVDAEGKASYDAVDAGYVREMAMFPSTSGQKYEFFTFKMDGSATVGGFFRYAESGNVVDFEALSKIESTRYPGSNMLSSMNKLTTYIGGNNLDTLKAIMFEVYNSVFEHSTIGFNSINIDYKAATKQADGSLAPGLFYRFAFRRNAGRDIIVIWNMDGTEWSVMWDTASKEVLSNYKASVIKSNSKPRSNMAGVIKADPASEEDAVPCRIKDDGKLYVAIPEISGLPEVTEADNGKILGVVDGKLAWVDK